MSFQPAHLKSGFRGSGLYPLSREAIHPSKLAPSVPFLHAPQPPQTSHTEPGQGDKLAATTTVELSCVKCGNAMTPVQLHVVAYFSHHLQGKKSQGQRNKKRVKPRFYGEALTSDDIFRRIEEEESEKIEQQKKKKQKQKGERREDKRDMESDRGT